MRIYAAVMKPSNFQEILDHHDRIALAGSVKCGKTLLLENVKLNNRTVLMTDDVRSHVDFLDVPDHVIVALEKVPRFVISGMVTPRVLRKGLEVDAAVWIDEPRQDVNNRQGGFSKGMRGIMETWSEDHPTVPVYFVDRALHEDWT